MTDDLDWPAGFERTPAAERERNRSFQASLADTTADLETEISRMDVDEWRASIGNQHTKSNGLPLHNANPADPGFVLRWTDDGEQYAVACDAYSRLRDNARTVYLWINETRMRSQRPVETGDAEFAAARLPPGDGETDAVVAQPADSRAPHEVLSVQPDAPDAVVEAAARERKAETHPDAGGSRAEFQKVIAAEEEMIDAE